MNRHVFILALSSFLFSLQANAVELGQFDARSTAMGGAGVAGANSANAAAFNPALIATDGSEKHFSMIPLVLNVQAYDENGFLDNIDGAENAINGNGGLDELMLSINGNTSSCGANCYNHPLMADTALKTLELLGYIDELNKSKASINANTGLAVQFGKTIPLAIVLSAGAVTTVGLKFSDADLYELNAYANAMSNGEITQAEFLDLNAANLALDNAGTLYFSRIITANQELHSLVEVVGASYVQLGVSIANNFNIAGQELALGITPKLIEINAVKHHQTVEEKNIDVDIIFADENIISKSDFNADIGITIKPVDAIPLKVGVAVKNLFTRTYELKKSQTELELEAGAYPEAAADLAKFNLVQELKIEPQLTAGIAYSLPLVNLLADIDLNEAEVLGQNTQELSMGAEFSLKFLKLQLGHTTSIGGDDVQDSSSAGFTAGFFDVAAVFTGDHIGGVIQTSFSF